MESSNRKKVLVQRCIDYRDKNAVANRRIAAAIILATTFLFGMFVGVKADKAGEKISMQPVKKAEWAVAYSKARGEYPYE